MTKEEPSEERQEKVHALQNFMSQVTEEMAAEYRRIFSNTADDPGTAGDEGEENWATLLREWLPPSYHVVTKGRLIGSDGSFSPQIDVLVLKPFYPLKLREKKTWLADGVAAAFECKTTVRAEHLKESAKRCIQFKSLVRRRTGTPEKELRSRLIYGLLGHSHQWKAPKSQPVDNISKSISAGDDLCDHPSDLIDLICVADLACWNRVFVPFYPAAWREGNLGDRLFDGRWEATSAMTCAAKGRENQSKGFQPIGAMLCYLISRIAWDDQSIRDLADYFRLANMFGQASAELKFWDKSIYSDEVRLGIEQGKIAKGMDWSGWNVALFR